MQAVLDGFEELEQPNAPIASRDDVLERESRQLDLDGASSRNTAGAAFDITLLYCVPKLA